MRKKINNLNNKKENTHTTIWHTIIISHIHVHVVLHNYTKTALQPNQVRIKCIIDNNLHAISMLIMVTNNNNNE